MTAALPDPIPLDMPPGDAAAIADLARDVAGAVACLAAIDDRLVGAASDAPGWLGDDATAAAVQVGAVAALVRRVSTALAPVVVRLHRHAERVLETRRQVAALVAEQHQQLCDGWRRMGLVDDLQLQVMTGGPTVRAIVDDVEAGEASRRRRHTALLEELEDDAAATARLLTASSAVVGGRGAPGDGNRVVAYLAAELPGWGDLELARRGRALAGRLTAGTVEEKAGAAADAELFAGRAAFAAALLAGLGTRGVTYVLRDLGGNTFGPESSVARVLALAFGAAGPTGGPDDPATSALDARYVEAGDRYGDADLIAAGLATVLVAGLSLPSGGVRTRTVAEWSRQLLLREHEQGEPVGRRWIDGAPELSDPTELAVGILAEREDTAVSAALLADSRIWEALLSRVVWGDAGEAVGALIGQAGLRSDAGGSTAVRTGLEALGSGLDEGDPAAWTVNRDTVAVISPALGRAVATHLAVATDALRVGVDGSVAGDRRNVLEGLGYLTLDGAAATAVEQALRGWIAVQPRELGARVPSPPLPAIAIPAAYLAVKQYGQRESAALDGYEARETAENRQFLWDVFVAFGASLVQGPWSLPIGIAEGYGAILTGSDGTWENPVDSGPVWDSADAAAAALTQVPPGHAEDLEIVAAQAREAFERTHHALGDPRPPTSPPVDLMAPIRETLGDLGGERNQGDLGSRARQLRFPR